MGLFKPKARKVPDNAAWQVHFPGDDRNPDGSYRQTPADLQIDAAVIRVAAELARLRRIVSEGASVPSVETLGRTTEGARTDTATAADALELARRQYAGGVVDMQVVEAAAQRYDTAHKRLRSLLDDVQKSKRVSDAAAELGRILGALR